MVPECNALRTNLVWVQQFPQRFACHSKIIQNLCRNTSARIDQSNEEMFGADITQARPFCLLYRFLKEMFRTRRKGQITWQCSSALASYFCYFKSSSTKIHSQR